MKHTDTLMPYILASMHPMLHLSLLTSSVILYSSNYDKFFEIPNEDKCDSKDAQNFMKEEKYWLVGYASCAHLLAVIFHYMSDLLISKDRKVLGNLCMIFKVFLYVSSIFVVQTGIMFPGCRDIVENSQVMAWLNYEILAFYLNIMAMGVFLLLSSCKKFKSIRERMGWGAEFRKTMDFLTYCKDDIHWFCMWFTQLMLCVLALVMRTKQLENIQWCVGLLFTRHLLEVVLLRQVYFNSKFEIKSYLRVLLGAILVLNCFLIKLYIDLQDQDSTWWAPVLLQDIMLHFYIFLQLGVEWFTWGQREADWQKEQMFMEQFIQQPDQDEKQLRSKIQLLATPLTQSQKDAAKKAGQDGNAGVPAAAVNESKSADEGAKKPTKELKLTANMYTVAYSAFMKKNKEKFRLTVNDQMDIYYRAIFMCMIQLTFIFTVLFFEDFDISYKNNTPLNLCLFFTVLILHWQCLPEARNGIYMMKYALCYPDEFTAPVTVFFLGVIQISAVWLTETCNLLKSMDQKKPDQVIVRFVGFGLILNVPSLLIGSLESFDIKSSVGKLKLERSRKQMAHDPITKEKMPFSTLLNLVYCLCKWFFSSLYHYFFPFVVIFGPALKLTYMSKV